MMYAWKWVFYYTVKKTCLSDGGFYSSPPKQKKKVNYFKGIVISAFFFSLNTGVLAYNVFQVFRRTKT